MSRSRKDRLPHRSRHGHGKRHHQHGHRGSKNTGFHSPRPIGISKPQKKRWSLWVRIPLYVVGGIFGTILFFSIVAAIPAARNVMITIIFLLPIVFAIGFIGAIVWFARAFAKRCPQCRRLNTLKWKDEFLNTGGVTNDGNGKVVSVNNYLRHEWCDACGYRGTRHIQRKE